MATTQEKDAAILEPANPLWEIEASLKAIRANIPAFFDGIKTAQDAMGLSSCKCKSIDRRAARILRAFEMLDDCVNDFHDKANRVIREEGLIVPLSGGGGKGDDDDDDGDPEIPPGGGG